MPRRITTLLLLPLALLLSACSVMLDLSAGAAAVPLNEGPRMDLVIDSVDASGWGNADDAHTAIRRIWTQDESLRSWFLLTDRMADPAQTVFLNARVGSYDSDSTRIGTPKHGYTTIRSVDVDVSFELVDARTGTVLAASRGGGIDRSSHGSPDRARALNRAVANGLAHLVREYAGAA